MNTNLTQEGISQRLQSCPGWEAKSRLLIQLAREIPPFAESERSDANRIAGCESQVWLKLQWIDGALKLETDSDSRIVKGLLALVYAAYEGRNAEEVSNFDFERWLTEMGLGRLLTASRSNGLKAIVQRLRSSAGKTRF